jgi:hypothetical protein
MRLWTLATAHRLIIEGNRRFGHSVLSRMRSGGPPVLLESSPGVAAVMPTCRLVLHASGASHGAPDLLRSRCLRVVDLDRASDTVGLYPRHVRRRVRRACARPVRGVNGPFQCVTERRCLALLGAAKESNLPSRGLPGPASFEDWMGHQARAAPGPMVRARASCDAHAAGRAREPSRARMGGRSLVRSGPSGGARRRHSSTRHRHSDAGRQRVRQATVRAGARGIPAREPDLRPRHAAGRR